MLLGIERASSATKLMIDQIGAVADAWGRAATAAQRVRYSSRVRGCRRGSGGGRGGPRDEGLYGPPVRDRYEGYNQALRDNQRYDREQRMNADALNRNEDQITAGRKRPRGGENAARDLALNDGPIGPTSRPYWGQGDEWVNAREENLRWRQIDDGLSIPPPPRTGVTDLTEPEGRLGLAIDSTLMNLRLPSLPRETAAGGGAGAQVVMATTSSRPSWTTNFCIWRSRPRAANSRPCSGVRRRSISTPHLLKA